ncbi:MAG: shikimate kinase [Clostridia bacterium]|nr:shikimate kinase [Clostridia bacterium]
MIEIKNNVISLIGMTGCGKSSVGRILARKLGARLIDLDDEIVSRHGEIKKIFAEQGEAEFRKIEFETLSDIIATAKGELCVLSCGGGVPTYEPSRELIADKTTVIWLRRSADSVAADEKVLMRPPINGDIDNYKRLLDIRYPIYRKTAHYSFYNAFPQRTAAAIIKKLLVDTTK